MPVADSRKRKLAGDLKSRLNELLQQSKDIRSQGMVVELLDEISKFDWDLKILKTSKLLPLIEKLSKEETDNQNITDGIKNCKTRWKSLAAAAREIKVSKLIKKQQSTSSNSYSTTSTQSSTSTQSFNDSFLNNWDSEDQITLTALEDLPPKRTKCISILKDALCKHEKELSALHKKRMGTNSEESGFILSIKDPHVLARVIEAHVHMEYPDDYGFRIRTLKANFVRNTELVLLVRQGIISPQRLAVMGVKDMATSELKEARAKAAEFFREASRSDWLKEQALEGADSQFQCFRCRSKKIRFHEMQTRSADEPMTVFCLCMGCGNRWKQ